MRENIDWVERKITQKQLKMIWTLARQLGMDTGLVHEMVFNVTGKDSLKKLTVPEGVGIIDGLVDDGARVRRKRIKRLRVGPNVIELLTGKQIRLIEYLVDQLGWGNPEQLKGFNRRVIKKERICTIIEASKVIEGLKAMVNRKGRKEVKKNGMPI